MRQDRNRGNDRMNPEILKKMRFTPTGHNSIYCDNLETICDVLEEICPIDTKKAIPVVGAAVGMSNRFVREHLARLEATEVIIRQKGQFHWNCGTNLNMKNEDVPDTIPESMEEMKPCIFREEGKQCNPSPGVTIKPSASYCNLCSERQEE